ncbi:DUF2254 domain-containing protein, partial [Micrococcus endophyticus]
MRRNSSRGGRSIGPVCRRAGERASAPARAGPAIRVGAAWASGGRSCLTVPHEHRPRPRHRGRAAAQHPAHVAPAELFRPFWVIPALVSLAAVVVGLTLPLVDAGLRHQIGVAFPGGPDGARSVLGTIASAMISVTGLVFSITMVVMQLASSQFSPRILQDFLSTRITQWTLGAFVASFVYSLTVLREVRGASGGGEVFVPQLSVSLAYVLVLTAFALFLAFIRTIMSLIQVSDVVSRIGEATCRAVEEHFPEADDARSGGRGRRRARSGPCGR